MAGTKCEPNTGQTGPVMKTDDRAGMETRKNIGFIQIGFVLEYDNLFTIPSLLASQHWNNVK